MIRIKPKKKSYPAYDATKAKSYAERVKALLVERGTINVDISQVCDEAKENGCEPSMIRFAARELMLDDSVRKERDEKRSRYLHAVGLAVEAVESGAMSARQAAKLYSIGKSSVYKEMSVRALSTDREMIAADFELPKPEDGDDGITGGEDERSDQVSVATEPRKGSGEGSSGGMAGGPVAEASQAGNAADASEGGPVLGIQATVSGAALHLDEAAAPRSVGAVAAEPRVASPFLGDDPGDPPPFLRGSRTAQGRGA